MPKAVIASNDTLRREIAEKARLARNEILRQELAELRELVQALHQSRFGNPKESKA
jgi:heme oxygenase